MSSLQSMEQPVSLTVAEYFSRDFFEREKTGIWRRSWLLAGRVSDVPNPGNFFLFNLAVVDASIIVVHGKDGGIRAFHNACVHQGARLTEEHRGSCNRLRCAFHGWIYDLQGRLTGVPLREQFPGLDVEALALPPVALDTWGGFIFVNLDPDPPQRVTDLLREMPAALEAYLEQEDWQWHAGYKGVYDANWKIFVDNQSEGHHASFLHSRSIGGYFEVEDIPHTVYPDSDGVIVKIEVSRPQGSSSGSVKQTRISELAAKYSHHGMWTEKDGSSVAAAYPGALNAKRSDRWVFDLYVVFPNIVFLFEDDQFVVQRIWPISPDETMWELDHFFVGQPRHFGDLFNRELSLLQQMDTASEDTSLSEGIQKNYRSGAVDKAFLSELQSGVLVFQSKVRARAGGADA